MIRLVDDLRSARNITVVITIHTPEDIVGIADQVAFVAEGQVIATGKPLEVLCPGRDPRIAAFLG